MDIEYIKIKDFCAGHGIEEDFVFRLQEYELIEISVREDQHSIGIEELPKVEKLVRLHRDLHINLEGLDAIYHLLERTLILQNEVKMLKKRLNRHGEI